jgi:hypothetical protein
LHGRLYREAVNHLDDLVFQHDLETT